MVFWIDSCLICFVWNVRVVYNGFRKILVDDLAHGPTKYMGICKYTARDELEKKEKESKDEKKGKRKEKNKEKEKAKPGTIPASFKFDVPSFDETNLLLTYNENENGKQKNDNNNNNSNSNSNNSNENGKNEIVEKSDETYPFRRIDIKYIEYSQYYAALLYFTGSDSLNRHMRIKANEKHMILNETGVYEMLDEDDHSKKGKRVVVPTSEKDIFDCLGMDYIEPKDRSW